MELETLLRLLVPVIGAGIWWFVRKVAKVETRKELIEQALHLIITIILEAEALDDNTGKSKYIEHRVENLLSGAQKRALQEHFQTIPKAISYARDNLERDILLTRK